MSQNLNEAGFSFFDLILDNKITFSVGTILDISCIVIPPKECPIKTTLPWLVSIPAATVEGSKEIKVKGIVKERFYYPRRGR